jgi:hypothetical protein
MLDFFQLRFAYVHQINLAWIRHLTDDEMDLPHEIKCCVSKIINDQHIRLCQFQGQECESELLDIHSERYWEQLERANFKEWREMLFSLELEQLENSDPVFIQLYQVLHQHAQYLGQLKLLCEQLSVAIIDETLLVSD